MTRACVIWAIKAISASSSGYSVFVLLKTVASGSTWINTFGDGVGCTNAANATGCNCAYITGRDGGAVQGNDPLRYKDIVTRTDLCGGIPQMAPFCPILAGENASSGLGITNVVAVNDTYGLILTRPTNSSDNYKTPGAGLAVVDITSGTPECTRPFGSRLLFIRIYSTFGTDFFT